MIAVAASGFSLRIVVIFVLLVVVGSGLTTTNRTAITTFQR
jgi:hypothetical protein